MDLLKIRFSFCNNHKGEVKLQINFQYVSLSGSVVGIVLNNKNMSIINFIEIYNVFENKTSGPVSLNVIKQLQQWNLIAPDNQLTCDRGHNLKLCEDVRCIDGFTWRCRITSIHKKQKKNVTLRDL